jgi:hypothetical protein
VKGVVEGPSSITNHYLIASLQHPSLITCSVAYYVASLYIPQTISIQTRFFFFFFLWNFGISYNNNNGRRRQKLNGSYQIAINQFQVDSTFMS